MISSKGKPGAMGIRGFLIILILMLSSALWGQSINYCFTPERALSINVPEDVPDLMVQQHSLHLGIPIPLIKTQQWLAIIKPGYKYLNFEITGVQAETSIDIHSFEMPMQIIWRGGDHWSGIGIFMPSFNTEITDEVKSSLWTYNGMSAVVLHKESSRITLGFASADIFGEATILPLVGYQKQWDHFIFDGLFPQFLGFHYVGPNRYRLGFRIENTGDFYMFETIKGDSIELSYNRIFIGLDSLYPIRGPIHLFLRGGVSMMPIPMQFTVAENRLIEGSIEPAPFLSAGIILHGPE